VVGHPQTVRRTHSGGGDPPPNNKYLKQAVEILQEAEERSVAVAIAVAARWHPRETVSSVDEDAGHAVFGDEDADAVYRIADQMSALFIFRRLGQLYDIPEEVIDTAIVQRLQAPGAPISPGSRRAVRRAVTKD